MASYWKGKAGDYQKEASNITQIYFPADRAVAAMEMNTPEETRAAIAKFNEYDMGGCALRINLVKPREERPRN